MSRRQRQKQTLNRANGQGMTAATLGTANAGNMAIIPAAMLSAMMNNLAPQKNPTRDFAPGSPMQPYPGITPRQGPRQFSYPVGYNINSVDRTLGYPDVPSFAQLRALARSYSGIKLCERVWLDMVPKLHLKVSLRPELVAGGADEKDYQDDITQYLRFFEKPDRQRDLHSWLRIALKEQTQLDALAIYKHPNRGGGLYALEIVDGSTIKPLLDERGMAPVPPYPAYQQFPYGVPGGLYTSDQMFYYIESPSANTPFGFSRIESIILEVNQALRKKRKDLSAFTEGNIPAGFMEVPEGLNWSPDQIDAYEQAWNALLAGSDQQQVRMRFLQPGMKYSPAEQYALDTAFDQFLLNIATAAYGVSMADLSFTEDIHKSADDGQQNMLYRRTLYPIVSMYALMLTTVIRDDFHDDRFMASFGGFEEVEDQGAQAATYATLAGIGAIAPSDVAVAMKLPDVPKTGPFIMTKDGPLFLKDYEEGSDLRTSQKQAQLAGMQLAASGQGQQALQGSEGALRGQLGSEQGASDGQEDDPQKQSEARADLRRWRDVALARIKDGRTLRPFVSSVIDPAIHARIETALTRCQTADEVRAVFARATAPEQFAHWQDADAAIQQAVANMQASGIDRIQWFSHTTTCEQCGDNHNQIVTPGQRFSSGAFLPPEHPNCLCRVTPVPITQKETPQ